MKNLINLSLILVIGILAVLGCSGNKQSTSGNNTAVVTSSGDNKSTSSATPAATATPEDTGLTKAKYDQAKTGMKYEEVVKLFGSEGESLSESEIGNIKTVMYKWKGEGILSNAMLTFQNGKLMSKAQSGLK